MNPNTNVQGKTPTQTIVLYVGEASDSRLGFGTEPSNLSSPGPTIRIKITDVVNLTVINSGKMPHAFAVSTMPKTGATVLFNAQIGSVANPLAPGQSGTVVFVPNNAGTFYYVCPVSGHAELGMYGAVVVTG